MTVSPEAIESAPEFRIKMISLLLRSDWLQRYGTIMLPEHFPTRAEQDLVRFINTYYVTYHDVPDAADVLAGVDEDDLVSVVLAESGNLNYAADVALDFIKVEAMRVAILEAVDDIQSGEMSNIRTRVEDALAVGIDQLDMGLDLIDNVSDWMYDELHGRRYPTGWIDIDRRLGGGLVPGEYGLIMAPTGKGKTTCLINIGYAMAGLVSKANVLHVTCEMAPSKVLKRYAARVSGMEFGRIRDVSSKAIIKQFKKRAARSLRAHIRVVHGYSKTVVDLKTTIDNLRSTHDFHTDALIVDYADLLVPVARRRERRFELRDITNDLRMLGAEYDIPVWSATQAGRHALNKEVITLADISEAMEKANIADVVIALCQTADEERLHYGRLYGAKVRDAEGGFFVPVKLNLAKQSVSVRRVDAIV